MTTNVDHARPTAGADTEEPALRVVLLGASNLTRLMASVLSICQAYAGERRLNVLAALGHGRSYGQHASVLTRTLPGITQSGLWSRLKNEPTQPTVALLTDVGNDLLYSVPPETIAAWVGECLQRLEDAEAASVLTRLPLTNLDDLSEGWFLAVRTLFFPTCRLSLDEVRQRAVVLDELLQDLAAQHAAATVAQPRQWYGHDPLHIVRSLGPLAYHEILQHWPNYQLGAPPRPWSTWRWLQARTQRCERMWLAGVPLGRSQPARQWSDGVTLGLY